MHWGGLWPQSWMLPRLQGREQQQPRIFCCVALSCCKNTQAGDWPQSTTGMETLDDETEEEVHEAPGDVIELQRHRCHHMRIGLEINILFSAILVLLGL